MSDIFRFFRRDNKDKTKKIVEKLKMYDSLSPTLLDTRDVSTYIEAIDEALANNENKNIAITGAYGSGKSSIIKTYQATTLKKVFLNISLANFKVDSIDDDNNRNLSKNDENNLNRLLELSIFQQIFYHVDKSKIPDSRFRRINSLSKWNILWFVMTVIFWLISYSFLFHFQIISDWFPEIEKNLILQVITSLTFIVGIGLGLGNLRRIFNNSRINRFNIQSGDFEIDKDIDRSIINKHLDEIIYFFQATDYRIVVIEDLDRFNNTEIFSKLREINLLLNNSEQILKSKKPIVFIYAIRDDMFKDRDRVKFFDFIIPVIPIINPSNSSDILLKKLDVLQGHKPSKELIQGISYYIDDMRLLKNIWNEYLTYRDILKNSLSQDKLFTLITYKNFYPDDFVALHTNQSDISQIFEKREVFESNFSKNIDFEIEILRLELKELERHQIKDADELRKIYIATINEIYPRTVAFVIDNGIYELESLVKEENFNKLRDSNSVTLVYSDSINFNGSNYYSTVRSKKLIIDFENLADKVNDKISFKKRMMLVHRDYSYKNKIISKINNLQQKKKEVKNFDLKQLLKELDSKEILTEYQSNKLLIFCVTNGYIDKYYSEYISYFHGVNLSSADFKYLIALRSGVPFDFEFELKNIANLTQKIEKKYYLTKAILNYSLFEYWFSNSDFIIQQNSMIDLLSKESKESVDFLRGLPENISVINNFSSIAVANWSEFWKHLEENSAYSDDIRKVYFKSVLIYGDLKDIVRQSEKSSLKVYIENTDSFLNIFPNEIHFKKLQDVILELRIEFENLSLTRNALMDYIYETNRYKLNEHNLKTILEYNNRDLSLGYFDISNSDLENLKEFIEIEIDIYVRNILLDLKEIKNEPVESLTILLNKSSLSQELKIKLIEGSKAIIPHLNQINSASIKDALIDNLLISPTWVNVLDYYEISDKKINENLIKFLNEREVFFELTKKRLREVIDDKLRRQEFVKKMINSNELTFEAFSNLLDVCRFGFTEIFIDDLSNDKVSWVVENQFAEATKANFDYLKKNFQNEHIHLAEAKSIQFLKDIEIFELEDEDIFALIKSKKLSIKEKIIVFQKQVDYSLITRTVGMGEVVSNLLVDAGLKTTIHILLSLFDETKSTELRVKLLIMNFRELTDSDVYDLINKMPYPFKKISEAHKRPLLPKTQFNLQLVEKLKNSELISSFSETDKGIRIIAKNSL
ncbi:hypothetical protein [Leeuwenhoekiella sp. NPDC079379]|uniref:YobI family P-loop NTPase n=1 Tax=Leeuwenhoekiella sp. NPDC079379 TaxID=3364122 RepID=UPI0037C66A5C